MNNELPSKIKYFWVILVFWTIIIGAIVVYKEATLRSGVTVVLKTAPVDPRDLLRGNYVALGYEINQIDLGESFLDGYFGEDLPANLKVQKGDVLKVVLEPGKDEQNRKEYYKASRLLYKNETPRAGEIFIKGTVVGVSGNQLRLEYGIESYFAPEEKAKELEKVGRNGGLWIKVALDQDGRAVIKDLDDN